MSRAKHTLFSVLLLSSFVMSGCATLRVPEDSARIAFLASETARATWSFRIAEHAKDAYLFFDGRPRPDACLRRGAVLYCELRGLWPGGHTIELRLPGAVLRRSALIGVRWPERAIWAIAEESEAVRRAKDAHLAGVIVEAKDPRTLIRAAHAAGLRALVRDVRWIAEGGADGVLDQVLPSDYAKNFPAVRAFESQAPEMQRRPGSRGGALALAHGGIVDDAGVAVVRRVRDDKAFRGSAFSVRSEDEGQIEIESIEPKGALVRVRGDVVEMSVNAAASNPRAPTEY